MRKGLVAMVICAVGLAACGGPEDYEISLAKADAHGASADIIQECSFKPGGPSEANLSSHVDTLLEAYDASGEDAEVESTMQDAAGDLRECGMDGLADRLNDVTDE